MVGTKTDAKKNQCFFVIDRPDFLFRLHKSHCAPLAGTDIFLRLDSRFYLGNLSHPEPIVQGFVQSIPSESLVLSVISRTGFIYPLNNEWPSYLSHFEKLVWLRSLSPSIYIEKEEVCVLGKRTSSIRSRPAT